MKKLSKQSNDEQIIEDRVRQFRRYNIVQEFHCDKEPTRFNCRGCEYYFERQYDHTCNCLKTIVGDWALYHMEEKG